MILSKAPLRISFFGGSSDIPAFYKKECGATISIAIDKYVYVSLMHTSYNHIKVCYSNTEIVEDINDLKNDIVRETLRYFGIRSNIEINTFADIPTGGTGLGGSSAFTCALIRALEKYTHESFSEYDVANMAADIEINKCGWNIGKQDQYASAFGGMNYIKYFGEVVEVTKIDDRSDILENCILIKVPNSDCHSAHDIISTIDFESKRKEIRELVEIANEANQLAPTLENYAPLINKSWELKKKTSSHISSVVIDNFYNELMNERLVKSCKLLGAGGRGYMLVMTEHPHIIMTDHSNHLMINREDNGARVVYHD